MDKQTATQLIGDTFNDSFDEGRFHTFAINLLNNVNVKKEFKYISGNYIRHSFKDHITKYKRLGTYTDPNGEKIDVLIVQLKNEWALERSRTMLRNFTSDYLKNRDTKDAALVAYYTTNPDDWRFSYIRVEYEREKVESGKVKNVPVITSAKRYSFLVGKNEPNHTAQAQLVGILSDDRNNPTLAELETAFSVEAVTKQFYNDYRSQFEKVLNELEDIITKDPKIAKEFETKTIDPANFAKKLMGQIVFLYFLQKKGWLGVGKDEDGNFKEWGKGPKNFLQRLFNKKFTDYGNFFNDILEPLFYEALATERDNDVFTRFNCKIPFLNGGLFEPINDYNWGETDIRIDNHLIGDVFKTFDQYNFTVREDEPLEKEVAVDPEMLGKVFENLLPENLRKGQGAYYTPRTIVHYMCQESLINYLDTECEPVPKEDIEILIREGDIILELETAIVEQGTQYDSVLMDSIKKNAEALDCALANIKVCDPAIGSGAFPLGMLTEIVKARKVLELYLDKKPSVYELKRHCIQNSLYGVDIDSGAIEIAKLRLWLSLVVDEDDHTKIQPLPNLDYKIMQGNSLIEEFHGISLDIEKKSGQQPIGNMVDELDELVDDLHKRQSDFFNAEHPKEKKKNRDAVEKAIYNIFHHELVKNTWLTEPEKEKIEIALKEMTHGNKERDFFPWQLYFADVFRGKGGFDVVIANPPYIGESGNKNIFRPISKANLKEFYQGKMDIFYFFFHLALNIGIEKSINTFISTNYYLTAYGAKKLRSDLKHRSMIQCLVNFNELKIFESALGQHNVITIFRKGKNLNNNAKIILTKKKGVANDMIISEIVKGTDINTVCNLVSQDDLYDGYENYIRLVGGNISSNIIVRVLDKVSQISKNTLQHYCRINQGVVSGCDRVSGKNIKKLKILNNIEQGDAIFVFDLTKTRDLIIYNNFSDIEKMLLRPFYKNSDIDRYWSNSKKNKLLLYLGKNHTDISHYPNIKKHLNKFRNILVDRREVKNGRIKYFQLQWYRSEEIFSGEKIVVPYRSLRNTFSINNQEWFCRSDSYVISPKSEDVNLKYIIALLNSSLYYLWLYHKGKRKGEMLELFQVPLSEIPIQKIGLDEQKPFINLVDKILTIKKANPQANTIALEAEIDQLLYKLYGLTKEEIAIVEESVR